MKNKIGALAFALAATACGGSTAGSTGESLPEAEQEANTEASGETASADINSEGACGLLSVAEIESVVGQTVVRAINIDGEGIAGNCTWEFESIEDGLYAGETPQLLVSAFEGSEYYDQILSEYPDSTVDGIGSAALRRAEGELFFLANSNTGQISSYLFFPGEPPTKASEAVDELSRILVDRLQ